ncbi:MAG: hypothetical protein V7K32_20010 [Nostoc sp.]|uniref:hypothetical protein n=1 Tax=Nostoc sp. TaxID=1180 RepID=UPI002FFA56AB
MQNRRRKRESVSKSCGLPQATTEDADNTEISLKERPEGQLTAGIITSVETGI